MACNLIKINKIENLPYTDVWVKVIALKKNTPLTYKECLDYFLSVDNNKIIYYVYTSDISDGYDQYLLLTKRRGIEFTLGDKSDDPEYRVLYKRVGGPHLCSKDIKDILQSYKYIEDYEEKMFLIQKYSGLFRETIVYAKVHKHKESLALRSRIEFLLSKEENTETLTKILKILTE